MAAPELELYDCQDAVAVDLAKLEDRFQAALTEVLRTAAAGDHEAPLADLPEIEASIVSDEAIAKVHADFMDDPTPTDVITFQHGELIVSADTAAREAEQRGWAVERELLLYLIHGLLHLHGYDDHAPETRERMHREQERILDALWIISPE